MPSSTGRRVSLRCRASASAYCVFLYSRNFRRLAFSFIELVISTVTRVSSFSAPCVSPLANTSATLSTSRGSFPGNCSTFVPRFTTSTQIMPNCPSEWGSNPPPVSRAVVGSGRCVMVFRSLLSLRDPKMATLLNHEAAGQRARLPVRVRLLPVEAHRHPLVALRDRYRIGPLNRGAAVLLNPHPDQGHVAQRLRG